MAYETKEGGGALFKNEYKTKETHPDYKGNALINGVEMEVAAWVKKSQDGKKTFMSLSIKPKQDRPSSVPITEEDLPF